MKLVPLVLWGLPWSWDARRYMALDEYERLLSLAVPPSETACAYCGAVADRHVPEWVMDYGARTRSLEGYTKVCGKCYEAFWVLRDRVSRDTMRGIKEHLAFVNGYSLMTASDVIHDAFDAAKLGSREIWTVDFSWVTRMGCRIAREQIRA